MKRKVFYSFHFKKDNWRVGQIRNIGTIEGNEPASDNSWEEVIENGDDAIQEWIDTELKGRSCTIVLIGAETDGRKWIDYEINKSWNDGKGILGIYIHRLKDSSGQQSIKGTNPFTRFSFDSSDIQGNLGDYVKVYDPPYLDSKDVYGYISDNISDWIEEAIEIRNNF